MLRVPPVYWGVRSDFSLQLLQSINPFQQRRQCRHITDDFALSVFVGRETYVFFI